MGAAAVWGEDGQIVFGTRDGGLFRLSSDGGEPEVLTTPDGERGEQDHVAPSIVPGADAIVFTIASAGGVAETGRLAAR